MSLSKKAVRDLGCSNPIPNYYWEKDIKEFINELRENICECEINNNPCGKCRAIERLAGENLL